MATPHKCPLCNGTGLVGRNPYIAGDVQEWSDSSSGPWQCHGCYGSGIVWEPTEILTSGVRHNTGARLVGCVRERR